VGDGAQFARRWPGEQQAAVDDRVRPASDPMTMIQMKRMLFTLALWPLWASPAPAQLPGPGKAPASLPKLTAKDIRVLPFLREFWEVKFKPNDREAPDELRVTTTPTQVHLYGSKRGDKTVRIRERTSGHTGKVFLLPPASRAGKLTVKLPSSEEVRYYYAVLEKADALDSKPVKLEVGKVYAWSIKAEEGRTTLRLTEGATEVVSLSGLSEEVKGAGFAATVREKDHEADLMLTLP